MEKNKMKSFPLYFIFSFIFNEPVKEQKDPHIVQSAFITCQECVQEQEEFPVHHRQSSLR